MKSFVSPSKSATNNSSQVGRAAKTIIDNRPTAVIQRKLKELANSSGVLQAKAANGGLPEELKEGIEVLSGVSLDNVRVHYNSSKPAEINALAYAQGNDIYLAPGQEKHLAHEAWHIVQQKQGRVRSTAQLESGTAINDNIGLELEADRMGQRSQHLIQRAKDVAAGFEDNRSSTVKQRKLQASISEVIQGKFSVIPEGYGSPVLIKTIQLPKKINPDSFKLPRYENIVTSFNRLGLDSTNKEIVIATIKKIDEYAQSATDYNDELTAKQEGYTTWDKIIKLAYNEVKGTAKKEKAPEFNEKLFTLFDSVLKSYNEETASITEDIFNKILNTCLLTDNADLEKYLIEIGLTEEAVKSIIDSNDSPFKEALEMKEDDQWRECDFAYQGVKELSDHILTNKPPTNYVYVIPGGSLVQVGIYMRQEDPNVKVIHMPISGLSDEAMAKDKRTFDVNDFGAFYQYYLKDFAINAFADATNPKVNTPSDLQSTTSSNSQPTISSPQSIKSPTKKLLVIDYSSSGTSISTIESQIKEYLKALGVPNPENYVEKLAFNTRLSEQLRGTSTKHINSSQSAIEKLLANTNSEKYKAAKLVLFDKPSFNEGNFRGGVKDINRQGLNLKGFAALWYAIKALRNANHKATKQVTTVEELKAELITTD